MELRVLKYFLMIAREENITRAAQLLHVTQPTLSRQIKELEEELGTKLFERSNHRIILTQDGLLLGAGRRKSWSSRNAPKRILLTKMRSSRVKLPSAAVNAQRVGAGEVLSSFRQRYPRCATAFTAEMPITSRSASKTARWISDYFPNRWIYPIRVYPRAGTRRMGRADAGGFPPGAVAVRAAGESGRTAADDLRQGDGSARAGQLVWR